MTLSKQPFYVLGRTNGQHWVLGGYGSRKLAQRAINWQGTARPAAEDQTVWCVCQFRDGSFYPLSGGRIDFPLRRAPYTALAYSRFMTEHGIDPKHMMEPKA